MSQGRVLIIDDEKNYLLILEAMLLDAEYDVITLNDPEMVQAFLDESEVDVVITDMKMPKLSGKEVLQHIKKNWPRIPVLMMTAFGTIENAVDIMRQGAFDYITKPFANDELLLSVQNAMELAKAHRQYQILQESLEERYSTHQVVGKTKLVHNIRHMVDKVAASRTSVLISGETGTGKELIAKAIHFSSSRKEQPFVAVNCLMNHTQSLEKELFGEESVGVTGTVAIKRGRLELADQGTLFLNEVGSLSLELQIKLLRVLQEKSFERIGGTDSAKLDLRLVTSSTEDLALRVQNGTFREDLFYALNVVQIPMPSLRERREDIPLLVAYFIKKFMQENEVAHAKNFTQEALNYMNGYDWPGNIRQLQNIIERCLVMCVHNDIGVEDLPPEIRDEDAQFKSAVDLLPVAMNLTDTLDKIEAAIVRRALARAEFVQSRAGELLGISRSLMQYKLKKYNITGH